MKVKCFTKSELRLANNCAIKGKCNAIDPERIKQLPNDLLYPVVFALPWERHGWVRCQVGTATMRTGGDYEPVCLDVPTGVFEGLQVMDA